MEQTWYLNLSSFFTFGILQSTFRLYRTDCNNSTFGTSDASGLKLLTRLRVGFSRLREHKFKHNCTLVPLKQIPITFLCAAKIFLISKISFSMALTQLTQRFIKWVRMRLFEYYYLVIKVLLKIWILGLLHPQFVSLKTVKYLIHHFLLERNLFDIFTRQ